MDVSFEQIKSNIQTLEETLAVLKQHLGKQNIAELTNLKKNICLIAKTIFPELENLNRVTFNLEKQPIWTDRSQDQNIQYIYYQKLINLQENVKESLKNCNDFSNISLTELPVTQNHFLIPEQVGNNDLELFESSIFAMQELEAKFETPRKISNQDRNNANSIDILMKRDLKKAKKELLSLKYNTDNRELFILLASQFKTDTSKLNFLFEVLDSPEGRIGLYNLQLKIYCLEACMWSPLLKNQTQYIREIRSCCAHLLNPGLWKCINKHLLPLFSSCSQSARYGLFPFFSKGIKAPDKQIRKDVIHTISFVYHINPNESIQYLIKALKDKDQEVREAGAYALSKLEPDHLLHIFQTIGFLIERDSSPSVRRTLAWSLGQDKVIGLQTTFLILLNLLQDHVEGVSQEAMVSLFKVQNQYISNEAVNSLKQLYKTTKKSLIKKKIIAILGEWGRGVLLLKQTINEPLLRLNAFKALQKIGSKAPEKIIPLFFSMLSNQDESFVNQEILPLFIHLGKENPNFMRKQIRVCLVQCDINPIAHFLIEILIETGVNKIEESIEIFEQIKSKVEEHPLILSSIAYAIGRLYRTNQGKGLSLLIKFVTFPHEVVRISVIKALGNFATRYPNDPILPPNFEDLYAMIQMNLYDLSAPIRKATIESCTGFADYADDLITPLLEILIPKEKDTAVRAALIDLIINIGKHNPSALLYLTQFNNLEESLNIRLHALKGYLLVESIQEILLKRIQPIIEGWGTIQFGKENEEEFFAEELFALLSTMIQQEITPKELITIETFFIKCLKHQNSTIKSHTIKVLPKLNCPSEHILNLLDLVMQTDLRTVIEAVASLNGPIQLKESFVAELIDKFNRKTEDQGLIFKILCQIDLSPYPDLLLSLMKVQNGHALQWTSFDSLLKSFEKTKNETYLFAIVHKCLTENVELFIQEDWLSVWSNKQLIQLNTIDLSLELLSKYERKLFEWKAQQLEKEFYVLAGYYYRKANLLDKMMACFNKGKEKFDSILDTILNNPAFQVSDALKVYPELEQCLDALCSLGICYQTGVGLKPTTEETVAKTDRLKKASEYYKPGYTIFNHYLSQSLQGICFENGVGGPKDLREAKRIFDTLGINFVEAPFPLHVFNLSNHPFCCDSEKMLIPKGTICIALATLEPTVVDRNHVIAVMDRSKNRPDHQFLCPYVELHPSTGDLIILIPKKLADNQLFMNKILQLGLVQRKVKEKRSCGNNKRTFTIEFVVPKLEIESFLRDELHLNDRVYFELMEVKKGKK